MRARAPRAPALKKLHAQPLDAAEQPISEKLAQMCKPSEMRRRIMGLGPNIQVPPSAKRGLRRIDIRQLRGLDLYRPTDNAIMFRYQSVSGALQTP